MYASGSSSGGESRKHRCAVLLMYVLLGMLMK
jgi:hypothetical protein